MSESPTLILVDSQLALNRAIATGGAVALTYSYNPLAANLDFLAEGDVVTIEYVVDVSDGTAHQPVTVAFKIVGTNDAPVFVSGTDAGAINDTVAADTFDNLSGALVAFDPDSGAQLSYALANGQSPRSYTYVPDAAAINALPAGGARGSPPSLSEP